MCQPEPEDLNGTQWFVSLWRPARISRDARLYARSENCKKRPLASSYLSACLSVRPDWTTRLPREGFSLNLIHKYFSKICRDISCFIKIWQKYRVLYMKTNKHLWSYLAQFFLEWKIFQTKFVEKIVTHILCPITFFFQKSFRLWDNVEQYCSRTGHRLQYGIWALHAGSLRLQTYTHNM
jgi:hypothetical protein